MENHTFFLDVIKFLTFLKSCSISLLWESDLHVREVHASIDLLYILGTSSYCNIEWRLKILHFNKNRFSKTSKGSQFLNCTPVSISAHKCKWGKKKTFLHLSISVWCSCYETGTFYRKWLQKIKVMLEKIYSPKILKYQGKILK